MRFQDAGVIEPRHSMQEILLALGTRLRRLREQKGVAQETFADICGLHRTEIGLLERGKTVPRLDTLLIVSEHLGIEVSGLLEGLKH
jgi:transcriptional regulator with XRE-family HTH domain